MTFRQFTIKGTDIDNRSLAQWNREMGMAFQVDYRYHDFDRRDLPNGDFEIVNIQVFTITTYTDEHAMLVKLRWSDFITEERHG